MAEIVENVTDLFRRELQPNSRVLLVNPPVHEKRYNWVRWNQPLDLLRLSTALKEMHPGLDTRLFDFMLPDERGAVQKHKVKETWNGGPDDEQLWHFGRPYEEFVSELGMLMDQNGWVPNWIIITSLTSYWHSSIEKLLPKLILRLGRKHRPATTIALSGYYPLFERDHAEDQWDADLVLAGRLPAGSAAPDFELYLRGNAKRLPNFFALDIEHPSVVTHLEFCLSLKHAQNERRQITRPASITVAFFNEDVCSDRSRLYDVADFSMAQSKKSLVVEGICGLIPGRLTLGHLDLLKQSGFRTLFLEHARTKGGGTEQDAYEDVRAYLSDERLRRARCEADTLWADHGNITAFINIGLPDDDMDRLIESTLWLNSAFQAIILKPHGYSPSFDYASAEERRRIWPHPRDSSPQWFPYAEDPSGLTKDDYQNLFRWQNLLNRRVKGATFDFFDEDSAVAQLVRETLVAESWRARKGSE